MLIPLVAADPPSWWDARGATNNSVKNDYAVVNQGQLKHFTVKAVTELNARVPNGAGADLNALVQTWQAEYQTYGYGPGNLDPKDFTAVNSGQLKWIAQKINNRLIYARYMDSQPSWISAGAVARNKELVNLGQLKTVFNFDLTAPVGQLPDWWQKFYFQKTGIIPGSPSQRAGYTMLACYQQGLSPVFFPPLLGVDSDGDGIEDSWELFYYGNLTTMTATSDADGDGILDVFEAQAGGDPKNDQSVTVDGRSNFHYDTMGRLTDAETAGETHEFEFDGEGNVEAATVTTP